MYTEYRVMGINIFNLNRLTFPKMITLKHFEIHLNILKSPFVIGRSKNKIIIKK